MKLAQLRWQTIVVMATTLRVHWLRNGAATGDERSHEPLESKRSGFVKKANGSRQQ